MHYKFGIKGRSILKATLFCVIFTGLFVVLSFPKSLLPNSHERLFHGITGTIAAFLVTLFFLKFDKKSFADIELHFERMTVVRFIIGIFVGMLIMGFLVAGVMYFTHVAIELNPKTDVWHFFFATAPLIPLAFMEELGFRAYPIQILKDKTGIRLSIVITSILFALYHIVNGWTIVSSFMGPAIWGLIFGLAAIYSRGIAMPTGIHYAANLTTSAFGAKGNTTSIWTVKTPDNVVATFNGIDWTMILPSLAILFLGLASIEIYMRRKTTRKMDGGS
jgi:hypothetical protein